MARKVVVVGSGIFGVTAALELRRRGWRVVLLDPGPIPHPLAASTDISKVVRLEYGADEAYMAWMEEALRRWRQWNKEWQVRVFHETGVLLLRRSTVEPGTYEGDSAALLQRRGHAFELLGPDAVADRFPAWSGGGFQQAVFSHSGGYAESSRVVSLLTRDAASAGVELREAVSVAAIRETADGVEVRIADGAAMAADMAVLACGSWMPQLLPETAAIFRTPGMPVFHLRPNQPERFAAGHFPVFTADVSNTGYYGFPVNSDGIVKIANHGAGRVMAPDSPERQVTPTEEVALRSFLAEACPALADAPLAWTRICLYCDTPDGHFWIDRHPEHPRIVVAAGGSGHAFKFAPLLGEWIADAVDGPGAPERFRWRDTQAARPGDAARATSYGGDTGPAAA